VIVAVPLGVLQGGDSRTGIEFDPLPRAHFEAVTALRMGTVVKVVLELDERFWVKESFAKRVGDERLDTLAFLHAEQRVPFPVWWTSYPLRAPVLVGWRGGPDALRFAGLPREETINEAIASLATLLRMRKPEVLRHVVAAHTHDWTSDPFARGAYSYAGVGGDDASTRLARPVQGTVFFAGEHADKEGRSGTVHGAIASGYAAADRVARGQSMASRLFAECQIVVPAPMSFIRRINSRKPASPRSGSISGLTRR
jgi:monoamine oxidase